MQLAKYLNLSKLNDHNDSIAASFENKHVFITGASGFLGKVLLEQLLRTCPDIGNIYILLREKRGQNIQDRVENITDNILFDKCRQLNPSIFRKIIPLPGDVREVGLGLSSRDRKLLCDNVSIVYHIAASVRFNESLTDAIIMNTRGTREVCKLVLNLKHVDVFQHVSTAYSQIDKEIVEEKLYRAPADWSQMIAIAEETNENYMKMLMPHLLFGYPNTYTFSKALAENVVADMCEGKVPTIIIRPTIVVSVFRNPLPGWIDNLNGPTGLIIASSKGVWRSNYVKNNAKLDLVPVDFAISAMIISTWIQKYLEIDKVSVYNCGSEGIQDISPKAIVDWGYKVFEAVSPLPLWCPNFSTTDSKLIHMCNIYLFHVLPAFIVDLILRITNNKPILFNVQRKIYSAVSSLEYFARHSWVFRNDKTLELFDRITAHDHEQFYVDIWNLDVLEYFIEAAQTSLPLLLNEDLSNPSRNRKIILAMRIIHYGVIFTCMTYFSVWTYNWFTIACREPLNSQ